MLWTTFINFKMNNLINPFSQPKKKKRKTKFQNTVTYLMYVDRIIIFKFQCLILLGMASGQRL